MCVLKDRFKLLVCFPCPQKNLTAMSKLFQNTTPLFAHRNLSKWHALSKALLHTSASETFQCQRWPYKASSNHLPFFPFLGKPHPCPLELLFADHPVTNSPTTVSIPGELGFQPLLTALLPCWRWAMQTKWADFLWILSFPSECLCCQATKSHTSLCPIFVPVYLAFLYSTWACTSGGLGQSLHVAWAANSQM